jgi:uncharacterized protein
MHDATDNAPIVCTLDASHIRRQMRLNPLPLLIAQPKQVLPHGPDPQNESSTYGIRIALPPQQN